MKEKGFAVVRYADDAVIFCKTKDQAEEAYVMAKTILEEELRLRMHPEKTKVVHFNEGFQQLLEYIGDRLAASGVSFFILRRKCLGGCSFGLLPNSWVFLQFDILS